MTEEPVGLLEAPIEPPAPPEVSTRRPRTPRSLWVVAGLVLIPVVAPLVVLFGRVLGAGSGAWEILFSARTGELLAQTLLLTAAVTATSLVVGTATAWLTVRSDLRWRRLWSVLVALPLVIPSYVVALVLLSAFGANGVVTDALGLLGVDRLPVLAGSIGAWLALSISTYPYVHLIASAGLRRIDPVLEDAARGLGAGPGRSFRTVVLSQLRPSLAASGLLVALYTISDFGAVSLMRFDAFTRVIYAQYQGRIDRTPAAVLAAALIFIVLAILWAEQRSRGRGRVYTRRPARKAALVRLEGWRRRLGYTVLAFVALAALALPLIVLATWLGRGIERGDELGVAFGAAAGSLAVSIAAGLVAVAAAIPVAILVVRHRSGMSVAVDRIIHSAFALPHIAVALAMVILAITYLGPFYQGFPLLIITYVVLFLPQASGAAKSALEQVNPHVEEAARGLGRRQLGVITGVTVPLIQKGLLAGGALVFLTAMKELPATLLLRPTGFDTLAVDIWSAASEGLFASAAAPALLLVVVSAIPMYLLVTRSYDA